MSDHHHIPSFTTSTPLVISSFHHRSASPFLVSDFNGAPAETTYALVVPTSAVSDYTSGFHSIHRTCLDFVHSMTTK